jgi:hypothetical protein
MVIYRRIFFFVDGVFFYKNIFLINNVCILRNENWILLKLSLLNYFFLRFQCFAHFKEIQK